MADDDDKRLVQSVSRRQLLAKVANLVVMPVGIYEIAKGAGSAEVANKLSKDIPDSLSPVERKPFDADIKQAQSEAESSERDGFLLLMGGWLADIVAKAEKKNQNDRGRE